MSEPRALVGKRYGNHVGRRFVRVAVEIADQPGRWWVTDLVARHGLGEPELFGGVHEIRSAARMAYLDHVANLQDPGIIASYPTAHLVTIGFRLPAHLARELA